MARKEPLVCVMPYITCEYDPEIYDEYDITGMNNEELMDCCRQIIQEKIFDDDTLEVLCSGLLNESDKMRNLPREIDVTTSDGTVLYGILTKQNCSGTHLTMLSPYRDVALMKCELIRDGKEFLLKGYKDCQHLYKIEDEIRALYPHYIEELQKRDKESSWAMHCAFRFVYGKYFEDSVLVNPERLFREWFGLEIFD